MARGGRPSPRRALLFCPLLLGVASSFAPPPDGPAASHRRRRHGPSSSSSRAPPSSSRLLLPGASAAAAGIPASSSGDRHESAISSVRSALSRPRVASFPLIECEFPSLSSLNKLGDGSLRSSIEAEDANLDFVARLVDRISSPVPWLFGQRASVVISSSASDSLVEKVRRRMGNDKRAAVYSLKGGGVIPEATKAGGGGEGRGRDVLIFMTPSSRGDYRVARSLAGSGRPVVIVNGSSRCARVMFMCPRSIVGENIRDFVIIIIFFRV